MHHHDGRSVSESRKKGQVGHSEMVNGAPRAGRCGPSAFGYPNGMLTLIRFLRVVMRIPTRNEIQPIANEQAVVEFYSR